MQCPHCQLKMQDSPQSAGQTVACPRCGGQFVASSGLSGSSVTDGSKAEQFDPYYTWLGIPPSEQPPNHYRLLGVQLFEANASVIENAADRQMKHLQSFKIGAKAALSQRLLTEVSAARVQLLDSNRKAAYDATLRGNVPAAVAQLPQLPEAGAPFTVVANSDNASSLANLSGSRRMSRRSKSPSVLSTVFIVLGGGAGLTMGVLLVFYLTGQDFLGLSGKWKQPQTQSQASPPQQPQKQESSQADSISLPSNTFPRPTPVPQTKAKTIVKAAPVVPSELAPVVEEPKPAVAKPPPVIALFGEAPRFLKLPPLASSAPITWFSFSRDLSEPPVLALHSETATLPSGASLRIKANPDDKTWTIEQIDDAASAGQKTSLGQIRLEGRNVSFAWSPQSLGVDGNELTDALVRRQLANCILEITVGNEFRNLQLREPLIVPELAIDFDHDRQNVELNTPDTPPSGKLFVKAELEGFQRGGRFRGDADAVPFTRPLVIEFADFKGPEIDIRFIRQTNGKLSVQIKPTFVETASRKPDLTVPTLEKLSRNQEQIRVEAENTINAAQTRLKSAQSTLQSLQRNQPSDAQSEANWRVAVANATATINQLNGVIAVATEKRNDAQARLTAVPVVLNFIESNRGARIKFTVFAKAGAQELVLVDGTGQ